MLLQLHYAHASFPTVMTFMSLFLIAFCYHCAGWNVEKHRNQEYTEQEREWQLLRRGRYLEFNLLYDRGVRFGLDGGRMESIMVSAPPLIAWK